VFCATGGAKDIAFMNMRNAVVVCRVVYLWSLKMLRRWPQMDGADGVAAQPLSSTQLSGEPLSVLSSLLQISRKMIGLYIMSVCR
jgi:hypothetical protein